MAADWVARTPEDLPRRALDSKYQGMLGDGLEEHYGAALSLILHMVWCGWPRSDISVYLLQDENLGGLRYQRMPRHKARRKIQRDYEKAYALVAAELSRRLVSDPLRLLAWEDRWRDSMGGRTRQADLAVLRVLVAGCVAAGVLERGITSRTIALQTGLAPVTVQRALQRLADRHGAIKLRTSEAGTVYALLVDSGTEAVSCFPHGVQETASLPESLRPHPHPLFEPAGLGPSSGAVYAAIAEQRSAREVAALTRLSVSQVHVHLRRLSELGIATSTLGQWEQVRVDLDDIARHLGVPAKRRRRQARIKEERAQWAEFTAGSSRAATVDRRRAMEWQRQRLDDLARRSGRASGAWWIETAAEVERYKASAGRRAACSTGDDASTAYDNTDRTLDPVSPVEASVALRALKTTSDVRLLPT